MHTPTTVHLAHKHLISTLRKITRKASAPSLQLIHPRTNWMNEIVHNEYMTWHPTDLNTDVEGRREWLVSSIPTRYHASDLRMHHPASKASSTTMNKDALKVKFLMKQNGSTNSWNEQGPIFRMSDWWCPTTGPKPKDGIVNVHLSPIRMGDRNNQ